MKEKKKIEYIKIENFKSYRKFIFIGPLEIFSCFIGKNGAGKTNFLDSLLFVLGKCLEEINCYSIQNLFPEFQTLGNFHTQVKIGFCIINQTRNVFVRTLTFDNFSEFFLNDIKISSNHYKQCLKKFKITGYKEFLILKNLIHHPILYSTSKLTEIVDKISGSKKLSFAHLKLGVVRKKFQKNSFLYFQKLKFLLKEKNFLKRKKLLNFLLKKKFEECTLIQRNLSLFLLFYAIHKVWTILKKKKKKIRGKKESNVHKTSVFSFSFFLNGGKKQKKKTCKIINFYFQNILIKILKSCIFQISWQKKIFFEDYYSKLKRNEIWLHKKNEKKTNMEKIDSSYTINRATQLVFHYILSDFLGVKKNSPRFILEKNIHFSFWMKRNLKRIYLREYLNYTTKSISCNTIFFDKLKKKMLCKNLRIFLLNKEKDFLIIFYSIVSLLYCLLKCKNKKSESKILNCDIYTKTFIFYLKNSVDGIRGKFSEIIKPLDSKFKKSILLVLKNKRNHILVDTLKTAFDCLYVLKKRKKKLELDFVSIKNIHNRPYPLEKNSYVQGEKIADVLDFDIYDVNFVNFFSKNTNIFKKEKKEISFKYFKKKTNFCFSQKIMIENTKILSIGYNNETSKWLDKKSDLPEKIKIRKNRLLEEFDRISYNRKKINSLLIQILKNILEKVFEFPPSKKKKNHTRGKFFFKRHSVWLEHFQKKKKVIKKVLRLVLFLYLFSFKLVLAQKFKEFISKKQKRKIDIFQRKQKSFFIGFETIVDRIRYFKLYIKKDLKFERYDTTGKKKKNIFPKNYLKIIFGFLDFLKKESFLASKKPVNFSDGFIYITKKPNYIEKKKIELKIQTSLIFVVHQKILKIYNNVLKKEKYQERKLEKNLAVNGHFLIGSLFFFFLGKKGEELHYGRENTLDFYYFCSFFEKREKAKSMIRKKIQKERAVLKKKKLEVKSKHTLDNRFSFIEKRYLFFKNKLIRSRYQFFFSNSKYAKIGKEREKRFKCCVDRVSEQINFVYKDLTRNFLQPKGGTAFLTIENSSEFFFGSVVYTAIPPSKGLQQLQNLSGGEKTVAVLALILGFDEVISQPFILVDEADSFLDVWHSQRFFSLLKKLTEKSKIQICVITLNVKFLNFFSTIFCIFKYKLSSNSLSISCTSN